MKKTVLFITREIVPFYYGGIGTQFKAMAHLLVLSGFKVIFLTQRGTTFDDKQFEENYPGCDVSFVDCPCSESIVSFSYSGGLVSHFNLSYAVAVNHAFDTLYNQYYPEFVVSADFGAEAFFCFQKKQAGVYKKSSFVLFIVGSTYDSLKTYESGLHEDVASELDDPQNRLTCSMENICVRLADDIVTPTHLTWNRTRQRLGLNRASHIIPNLVGPDFLKIKTKNDDRQSAKNLLFVGRLDRHKGADILLESFLSKYGQSGDSEIPILRFVGRDTFCKKYEMTFLDYWKERIPSHLKRYIEFTGQVQPQTVQKYLGGATLCVFPSRWEVFGIVCLEAMASGCPVAVSSYTGLSEVVGDKFEEFKIDFIGNNMGLFDLLDRLFFMEQKSYISICNGFRERAVEIVEFGDKALLDFFKTKTTNFDNRSSCQTKKINNDNVECLNAIGEISSALAYDFNKITALCDLDENSLKSIILPAQQADGSGKIKRTLMKRRLGRFLIKQIVRLTH